MKMTVARKLALAGWLVLPLGAWAYHEGPGQDLLRLDEVDGVLARAAAMQKAERWLDAIDAYDDALGRLPADATDAARRIRLERSKAAMESGGLPEAHGDLRGLVDELLNDASADPALLDEARQSFASSQYYMTWLMRLEGQPRDKWEPEIDAARQTFRLLAERAHAAGDTATATTREQDLEAAVRLERMEVKELQGLPLPSQ